MSHAILEAEVTGKYDHAGDANKLVYSPLAAPCTYHATRRYTLEFEGDEAAARRFVEQTLVEEVSQQVHFGSAPALDGATYILDYGYKPGALDLERETILSYYRGLADPGFTLHKLIITQRIYLFAEKDALSPDHFIRDIVNPAIHRHTLVAA